MNRLEILMLSVLLVVTLFLRFPHLGYSDYIGDEHKAFFQPLGGQSAWMFFMEQRKGPMQFIVSYIPYLFTQNWRNELAERIPFTIFNAASIFVFYAFVKKLTKDYRIAFLAAFILSVNGFIVGFSRIAQYQSLNLFFSPLALYFYADFLRPNKNLLRNSLLGTLAFSLSLLSHWDAIFVLPPILIFFICYLKNKSVSSSEKISVLRANLILGGVLLLPFLFPYISFQFGNAASREYFSRRVEIGNLDFARYPFLIKLYNPFLTLEFLLAAGAVSLLFVKRTWIFLSWFLINFLIFMIFVKKPDTHIYNFIIPFIVLASTGAILALERLKRFPRAILFVATGLFLTFFTYQSYLIFVDHRFEYPMQQERIWVFTTPRYSIEDQTPIFGFPYSRGWNEINAFINSQNSARGEDFGYQSNEAKTITEWYMDVGYAARGSYAVGIKWPVSFVTDMKFTNIGRKEVVYEGVKDGEVVVRIYRVAI